VGNPASLIFNFQTLSPITVTRFVTPQTLDAEGAFVDGATTTFPATISIQPFSPKDTLSLPEGDRNKRWMKGYCAIELVPANEKTGIRGDLIPYDGVVFEVRTADRWVGDLSHWKITMAEVNPE